MRRWATRRQFAACLEDAQRVVQRRDMAVPGLWEPDLYACCITLTPVGLALIGERVRSW